MSTTLPDHITDWDAAPLIQGLIQAANLISEPHNHSRHEAARTADGHKVHPWHDDAAQFCSVGAIQRVFRHSSSDEIWATRILGHFISRGDSYCSIHALNDLLPHDMLMVRWSEALTKMKEHYHYGNPRTFPVGHQNHPDTKVAIPDRVAA